MKKERKSMRGIVHEACGILLTLLWAGLYAGAMIGVVVVGLMIVTLLGG